MYLPTSMEVQLDISKSLKDQFINHFQLEKKGEAYPMNPAVGKGGAMRVIEFPGELEFYHFGATRFTQPIEMSSVNPPDTNWFIIHINLSKVRQEKKVEDKTIHFQKFLPIGILLYGPKLEIFTLIPAGVESEVTTIRFSKSFLDNYFKTASAVIDFNKNLSYEDLDHLLESCLNKAIDAMSDKLRCHALILEFLDLYFKKLKLHEQASVIEKLHPTDIQNLFKIVTLLRDPLNIDIPPIKELAVKANMGSTKFKTLFRQVFGKPPKEYRHRIRMEYAYDQIKNVRRSPTELSHELGYAHPSNFTLAYKKYFGSLPSS